MSILSPDIRVIILFDLFFAQTGCNAVNSNPHIQIGHDVRSIGFAEMRADRSIILSFDPAVVPYTNQQVIKLGDSSHSEVIAIVGGLEPGERKQIPKILGMASMSDDGVITLNMTATGPGPTVAEPTIRVVRPGDPKYETTRASLGGLNPGETKPILP